jgi:hypothetical protein
LHAGLAANATIAIEVDNAVVASEQGGDRADRYARGIVTVIAPENREEPVGFRELTLLDVLDPRSEGAEWNFVL